MDGGGRIGEREITIELGSDVSLGYKIKKKIGSGSVGKMKEKGGVSYKIRKKEGLIKVMEMINGRLRTKRRVEELLR